MDVKPKKVSPRITTRKRTTKQIKKKIEPKKTLSKSMSRSRATPRARKRTPRPKKMVVQRATEDIEEFIEKVDHSAQRETLFRWIYSLGGLLALLLFFQIAVTLVIYEEDDHRSSLHDLLVEVERSQESAYAQVVVLEFSALTIEDRKTLFTHARELDSLALITRNRYDSFMGDYSVWLLGRDGILKERHYRTQSLELYLERTARSLEQLAYQPYIRYEHMQLLNKNHDLLQDHVDFVQNTR